MGDGEIPQKKRYKICQKRGKNCSKKRQKSSLFCEKQAGFIIKQAKKRSFCYNNKHLWTNA